MNLLGDIAMGVVCLLLAAFCKVYVLICLLAMGIVVYCVGGGIVLTALDHLPF